MVLLAACALALAWPATANATGPQGCVATDPSGPLTPNPCQYTALSDSSYAASGDWELTIHRGGRTIALSSADGDPPQGALQNGDVVVGRAVSPGGGGGRGGPPPPPPADQRTVSWPA
jgi:hypothetical protein